MDHKGRIPYPKPYPGKADLLRRLDGLGEAVLQRLLVAGVVAGVLLSHDSDG